MGKLESIAELENILSRFTVHPDLIRDVKQLLKGKNTKEILIALVTQLKNLDRLGYKAIGLGKNKFENLSHAPNLYSMHVDTREFNGRFLYSIRSDNTILLYGFYEREGKNRTDYSIPIAKAQERLRELQED